jgi:hypothetical protein
MLKNLVSNIADNKNKHSLSHSYRSKRFELFKTMLANIPRPIRILDLGGTEEFWTAMGFNDSEVTITLLNLAVNESVRPPFYSIKGDATHLDAIADQSYDVVFSNSVIEHVYTWENQQKMASEIKRVGKSHFIQTPNYWFPIEPHWVFPFFQFFPPWIRILLTRYFSFGHIGKINNWTDAVNQVAEIRLLSKKEYARLFPQSKIYQERFMGMTKSFVAIKE